MCTHEAKILGATKTSILGTNDLIKILFICTSTNGSRSMLKMQHNAYDLQEKTTFLKKKYKYKI